MKRFKSGTNYLTKVRVGKNEKYGIYKCEICLKEKELTNKAVDIGHDKTCGCRNGRGLLATPSKDGYMLSKGGYDMSSLIARGYRAYNGEYLHRIIATEFIPNPHNYTDVNHMDGDKQNNNVLNLEWCSRGHNIKHAYDTGLRKKNSIPCKTRPLSNENVLYIRKSSDTNKNLGIKFGVSGAAISKIKCLETYKDVTLCEAKVHV